MVRVQGPRLERCSCVRTLRGGGEEGLGFVRVGGEDVGGEGSWIGGLKNVDMEVWDVFCFFFIGVFVGFLDGGVTLRG